MKATFTWQLDIVPPRGNYTALETIFKSSPDPWQVVGHCCIPTDRGATLRNGGLLSKLGTCGAARHQARLNSPSLVSCQMALTDQLLHTTSIFFAELNTGCDVQGIQGVVVTQRSAYLTTLSFPLKHATPRMHYESRSFPRSLFITLHQRLAHGAVESPAIHSLNVQPDAACSCFLNIPPASISCRILWAVISREITPRFYLRHDSLPWSATNGSMESMEMAL